MANGLEIDHKRGSAWMRGRPAAVEECRREFQNKLASLFPGDFLAVSEPHQLDHTAVVVESMAYVKYLFIIVGRFPLISYRLVATDFIQVPMPRAALKDLANARGLAAAAAEARAETPYTAEKGYGDEPEGVELWADWPCSSVRLRGEPAVVRRAVS